MLSISGGRASCGLTFRGDPTCLYWLAQYVVARFLVLNLTIVILKPVVDCPETTDSFDDFLCLLGVFILLTSKLFVHIP